MLALPTMVALLGLAAPAEARDRPAARKGDVVGLVVLLDRPCTAELREEMGRRLEAAWAPDVRRGPEMPPEVPGMGYFHDGAAWSLICVDHGYADAEAAAAELGDAARAEAMRRHEGWMSVDLLGHRRLSEAQVSMAYREIGHAIGGMIGPEALAVYNPLNGFFEPVRDDLVAALRSDDPWPRVASPKTWETNPDRAEALKAASTKARDRWPEFVAAWQARDEGQIFFVKYRIRSDERSEYVWVRVHALDRNGLDGELMEKLVLVDGPRKGSVVHITAPDVQDWLYNDGRILHGGWTEEVLQGRKLDGSEL
jgi:uncharacterized protein YegJ (DUF2314 family)